MFLKSLKNGAQMRNESIGIIKPNTFIIGAQKSATTSLYDWLSQHPDVCGPSSIKDYPLFLSDKDYFDKEIQILNKEYVDTGYLKQKIVLQASVQYMFEERAIEGIYEFDSEAKLICVLRNPVDRAISAYNYFKKLNLERRSLTKALESEDDCLKGTIQERHDFTYKSHGLYAQQLNTVFRKFRKNQVLILLYEDILNDSINSVKTTFEFLNIDSSFVPEFRHLNETGKVRFKLLQRLFFDKSNVKKFIVNFLVDPIIPLHKRSKIRWAFTEWNTKKVSNSINSSNHTEERLILKKYFKKEIENLEQLIDKDLRKWKQ